MAVMVEHYLYFTTYYVLEQCMDSSEHINLDVCPLGQGAKCCKCKIMKIYICHVLFFQLSSVSF